MKYGCLSVVLTSLIVLTGCGTYSSLEHRSASDPVVFGGLRTDASVIKRGSGQYDWLRKQKFYNPYLDLPFSGALDVVLLPYTIYYAAGLIR